MLAVLWGCTANINAHNDNAAFWCLAGIMITMCTVLVGTKHKVHEDDGNVIRFAGIWSKTKVLVELKWWWRYMKGQWITKVITIHLEGDMNICTTTFLGNPFNSCWDISVCTKVVNWQTDRHCRPLSHAASMTNKNISTYTVIFCYFTTYLTNIFTHWRTTGEWGWTAMTHGTKPSISLVCPEVNTEACQYIILLETERENRYNDVLCGSLKCVPQVISTWHELMKAIYCCFSLSFIKFCAPGLGR